MLIETNKNLTNLNTFKVKATALKYIRINNPSDLANGALKEELRQPFNIIGSASNILFVKEYINKIIHIDTKGIVATKSKDYILIEVQAGELLHDLVKFCVENNYGGVENLALIPGTVGASPVQNVGAYGVEVKDIIHQVKALNTKTFKPEVFQADECEFSYRSSIFKKNPDLYLIYSVIFKLNINSIINAKYSSVQAYLEKQDISNPDMRDIYNAICSIRRSKLPDINTIGSVGSFFKNPIVNEDQITKILAICPNVEYVHYNGKFKLSAASLIEQTDLKHLQANKISIWEKQPLVIVNYGNNSGRDIFEFSELIINKVHAKFGIILEREVNIL